MKIIIALDHRLEYITRRNNFSRIGAIGTICGVGCGPRYEDDRPGIEADGGPINFRPKRTEADRPPQGPIRTADGTTFEVDAKNS